MRVWLLQTGEILPLSRSGRKMRTALLADELVSRGHDVTWWCSAFDHMSKRMLLADDEIVALGDRLRLRALRGTGYRNNVSIARYVDHRIIAAKFARRAAQETRPDVIVAAMPDLYLAYEAARFAQQAGIPLIVDARDQWPDVFLEVVPDRFRPLARLVLWRDFRRLKQLLGSAAGIVGSMDAMLSWALERAGRARGDRDRVFYLGAARENGGPAGGAQPPTGGNRITVVFTGTFGRYYRPTVLVRAIKHLNRDPAWRERIRCVIGGDGNYADEVRREAQGEPNVVLTGWLDTTAMTSLLAEATLGVIPMAGTIQAFPNKAYTYLSAGLPILSSVGGEFRDVMQTRGFGRHFEPNDFEALARLLQECWTDPTAVREMRARAIDAFARDFDARVIYRSYADYVEEIATDRRASSRTPAIRPAAWPSP